MVRMHTSLGRDRVTGCDLQITPRRAASWALVLAIGLLGGIGMTAADQADPPALVTGDHLMERSSAPADPAESTGRLALVERIGEAAAPRPERSPADPDDDGSLLDEAIAIIEPFEGRRHRVYTDTTGHATIGVGFNLDRAGAEADLAKLLPGVRYRALRRGEARLTDEQIDVLLRHDAARAMRAARREVENFDDLPREARLILIDMAYNLGSLRAWARFRAALAEQDFDRAADEMHDSRWRRQTGRRAAALIDKMRTLTG